MSHSWELVPFDPSSTTQTELWRELALQCAAPAVLFPEFVFECARILAPRPLWFAVCGQPDAPVALALIDRHRRLFPEVFIESQMPLGAWLSRPGESLEELGGALLRSMGVALRLGISQLDSRFVPRPASETGVVTLDYIDTAWVEVDADFAEYWAARGKNLRSNMRRQRERLASQGVRPRMEILVEPDQMRQAVADYASLESRGWKAEGGTAVSEVHRQTGFYVCMLQRFAALGMARVYRYFFDDRLVATELCLHDGRQMIILKTTYDETVSPLSPTSLLRQEMFEQIFGDGHTRRVEFYGALKEWHTRWTPLRRQIFHANVFRSPLIRQAKELMREAKRASPVRAAREPASGGVTHGTMNGSPGSWSPNRRGWLRQ